MALNLILVYSSNPSKFLIMKQVAFILTLFAVTIIQASAQGYGMGAQQRKQDWKAKLDSLSPEKIAWKMTEKMSADLSLSEEQKKKVYEINLKTASEQKALRDAMQKQQEQHKEKMKAHQDARIFDIEKVLTPEQKELWKKNRDAHHQQMQERKEQFQMKKWDR
jgi:low affinity Fe/Cu permease